MSTELLEKLRASLSDRYDVERELGQGGMATVFLARDVRHERKVAIKVLHEDLGAALGAERFRREIQIATSLTHPHILTLYDSGEAAGSLFYVMPFIEGESLRQKIDREQQLPIDQALKITGEVASALDYAHRKGVVHRDIKPENILLEDGHAIVADFGIARAVSTMGDAGGALTKTGMSLGTPTYMSPEQAFAEKDIDGRSDMYSLACVLYEMLVGQPPFTGPNAQAVMARHSMAEVPSMQIVRATIPDEVEDVVQKALAKSPADRFATVAEFAQELQECVIDYHTTTRRAVGDRRTAPRVPPGRRETDQYRVPKIRQRRWVIAAIAIAVLGLGGGGAWWLASRGGSTGSGASEGFDPRRIAVLYFDDVSSSAQLEYLADGLTESLIDQLAQIQALDVVSKSGVEPYRGDDVNADSVAQVLSAGTLVRGTVEEQGDRLRISVRIVDGNTGVDVNRKTFEHPKGDVFAVRDALAAEVAGFLRERVGEEVRVREARAGTSSVAAWTLLQRAEKLRKDGENSARQGDTEKSSAAFRTADSLLAQAEGLDTKWVEPIAARARVALSQTLAAAGGAAARPWIEKGVLQADRAIAMDARNADALATRGILRYRRWALALYTTPREADQLLDQAEVDLKTAVAVNPANAEAWNQLSQIYNQKDDFTGAKVAAATAYEKDAFMRDTHRVLWRLYATSYDLQQFNDAVKWCDEGGRRFPENPIFVRCRLWLHTTDAVPADPAAAWKEYEKLKRLTPPSSWDYGDRESRMLVAASLARAGQKDSARKLLVSARGNSKIDPEGSLISFEAFIRTLFNDPRDTDEAFRLLREYLSTNAAHKQGFRDSQSWWWKPLKADPRFEELVAG